MAPQRRDTNRPGSSVHGSLPATGSARPPHAAGRRAALLGGGAVFLVALLLFAPTIGHDFVWDDRAILLPSLAQRDWSRLGEALTSDFFRESQEPGRFDYWRPLVVLSHMIERSFFGDRPAGYHAVNVLLHAIASLLVFGLALRVLGRLPAALGEGLLFAVHPVHVEVVAWISGRSDLLLGVFLALSLLGDWQAAVSGRLRWRVLALIAFAAALLSKEPAVVFPALVAARVLLLPEKTPARPAERARQALRAALPSLLVLAVFLVARYGLLEVELPRGSADGDQRLTLFWTWWSAFWLYARLLIWPASLSIAHHLPLSPAPGSWPVGAGLAVLAAALWGVWRLRRTAPGVAFGLLLLLLAMAPLSSFLVPITSQPGLGFPIAERFLYAPSIGFCLAVGGLLAAATRRPKEVELRRAPAVALIGLALLGLALLAGAWASVLRARIWKSEVTLFESTLEQSPGMAMARLNYGTALMELARGEAATRRRRELQHQALGHLEVAVTLVPDNYRTHYNLAGLYQSLGRPEAAESALRETLRLRPELFPAMVNLGAILAQTGRPAEALKWFERADRQRPGRLAVIVNRAHALSTLERFEEAISLYRQALAIQPDLGAARAGLERALEARAAARRDGPPRAAGRGEASTVEPER